MLLNKDNVGRLADIIIETDFKYKINNIYHGLLLIDLGLELFDKFIFFESIFLKKFLIIRNLVFIKHSYQKFD